MFLLLSVLGLVFIDVVPLIQLLGLPTNPLSKPTSSMQPNPPAIPAINMGLDKLKVLPVAAPIILR